MQKQIRAIKQVFFIWMMWMLASPLAASAQDYLEVKAVPDTTQIRIGEQFKLHLSARVQLAASPGVHFKIVFPHVPDSFAHFELVERSEIDTTGSNNLEKIFRQTVTLTSFDSGRWQVPPMKFEVFSATDGSYDSVFSKPIDIDVNTVAVDTTKAFKPIKPLRTVKWLWTDYILYIAAGVLLLVVIGLLIWFSRQKRVPKFVAPPPTETPYEAAIRQLQQMKTEQAWNNGDIKLFYTQLTDILRVYIEKQFRIAALEQTSAELLQNIKPITILNQQRDKLSAILTLADLAKFAKLQPAPQEHEQCVQSAIEFVEWSKPKKEEVKEEGKINPKA
ncbi:hypothetical protein MKQ68_23620 [Chitinophaga horti]|uniref:Oxygen tolerance n=1 Tax=Chitinophaga horti TaxID=2920382 RepID=A0ABY6J450_9BACT|nr:hypothetical protein [Chitinophaga horti]UYQ93074.1 hypothetical protein MKQ68_23620 [Chitinophaga horti]